MIRMVVSMKIIVVSDSHGKHKALDDILQAYPQAKAYIHCGDIEGDPQDFPQFITVKGNNDMYYDYPEERILEIAGHRIFITHSHLYMVHKRVALLAQEAKKYNCDIVCYGHTHIASDDEYEGIRVMNPGSIWRARDGRGPSYAEMDLNDGTIHIKFKFLKEEHRIV